MKNADDAALVRIPVNRTSHREGQPFRLVERPGGALVLNIHGSDGAATPAAALAARRQEFRELKRERKRLDRRIARLERELA